MSTVQYSREAIKGLQTLLAKIADQFRTAFEGIADNRGNRNVKKLTRRERYRLRIGGYRGIYKIEGEQVLVLKLEVGPEVSKNEDTDH